MWVKVDLGSNASTLNDFICLVILKKLPNLAAAIRKNNLLNAFGSLSKRQNTGNLNSL